MDIKDLLWKFYEAGVDHQRTLNPRYSFEKTLTNNAQALQLLQPDVSKSVCKNCKKPFVMHSRASGLCPDTFKHFD